MASLCDCNSLALSKPPQTRLRNDRIGMGRVLGRSPSPPMKKSARKRLVAALDRVCSEYIRKRDNSQCVVCGSREQPTNGHLFTRSAYSTRWDELNCHCQCWACNYSHEHNPGPYTSWFVRKYGIDTYDELLRKHKQPLKLKDYQLQEMIDQFKEKLLT